MKLNNTEIKWICNKVKKDNVKYLIPYRLSNGKFQLIPITKVAKIMHSYYERTCEYFKEDISKLNSLKVREYIYEQFYIRHLYDESSLL